MSRRNHFSQALSDVISSLSIFDSSESLRDRRSWNRGGPRFQFASLENSFVDQFRQKIPCHLMRWRISEVSDNDSGRHLCPELFGSASNSLVCYKIRGQANLKTLVLRCDPPLHDERCRKGLHLMCSVWRLMRSISETLSLGAAHMLYHITYMLHQSCKP